MTRPPLPDPARWRRIEELFQAAVELPAGQRDAFLADAAGADAALRAEVEALLRADPGATAGGFGAAVRNEIRELADVTAWIGARLGPYRLERELGRGGMGTVFLGVRDDDEFHQRVAVKLLRRGLESTEAVARFRDERQLLAALEHPGIVRLLDGGSVGEGLPYLVMEYVEGEPITDYCEAHRLPLRERLELFVRVCAAVEFAHQHLVVHRDLKPSNILVGGDGVPKLLDFGIAKLLDEESGGREARTRTGMHLFTPEYASPEQARAEPISVASDVYSLGAVLYEMLTGVRAHQPADDPVAILRAICERDPPRPSTVAPAGRRRALAGDLDNIVLKALQKEPGRRYPSVEQLAEDLRRYFTGRPVLARAGTWTYRAGKFVRRRRGPLAVAGLVAAALSVATLVSVEQARRAERRFGDVRRLANSLLFEVDEQIQNLEGATAARELIVRRAREYLDSLAAEAGADPELARELAEAYFKTGEILGNERGPNLGRPREALESYQRARQLLDGLLAAGEDDPGVKWSLARVLQSSALLLDSSGQPAAARDNLRRAVELAESIPDESGFDYETALLSHLALFELGRKEANPEAVASSAAAAIAIAQRWARARPSPQADYWVGITHEMLGISLTQRADPDAAATALETARGIFRRLTAAQPDHEAYRRELWMVSLWLGRVFAGVSEDSIWEPFQPDAQRAATALDEALRIAESRIVRDRADQRAAQEAGATMTVVAVHEARRSPAAAMARFERARRIWEAMPDATRESAYNNQFGRTLFCSMAEPLARLGRAREARSAMADGLVIAERDGASPSANFEARTVLLMCRYQAARTLRVLGDPAAAPLLAATIRNLHALREERPQSIQVAIGLVEALRLLAELSPSDGCRVRAEALQVWRSLPGPPTPFRRRLAAELEAELAACGPGASGAVAG